MLSTDNITDGQPQWPKGIYTGGCVEWAPPNHFLYQMANAVLIVGLSTPRNKNGVLIMHGSFVLGYLLMSVWSWVILCAPDFFSWNFAFMMINAVQCLFLMYSNRHLRFCSELEDVYNAMFKPLQVPRHLFQKLTSSDFCTLLGLHEGEAYCTQGITKTDRLGLLISGRMSVFSNHNVLHQIGEKEFIDSPEFESCVTGEEKYQVSILATNTCRYLMWNRQTLEYLLMKEQYLANILIFMLGRDITTKLYALNDKVISCNGMPMDIRLPTVSSAMKHQGQTGNGACFATPSLNDMASPLYCMGSSIREQGLSRNINDISPISVNHDNAKGFYLQEEDEEDSEEVKSFQSVIGSLEMEKTELLNGHALNSDAVGRKLPIVNHTALKMPGQSCF